MPISDAKRKERRDRMLGSARDLLGAVGYDGITMKNLAAACGVTTPTLYSNFGGKDEMLLEAVMQNLGDALEADLPGPDVRGVDRLVGLLEALASSMMREPNFARMLIEAYRRELSETPLGATMVSSSMQAAWVAMEEIRASGDLLDWVNPMQLLARLATVHRGTNTEWMSGSIQLDQLANVMVYGAALMVAGATTGATQARAHEIARERQSTLGSFAGMDSLPTG